MAIDTFSGSEGIVESTTKSKRKSDGVKSRQNEKRLIKSTSCSDVHMP